VPDEPTLSEIGRRLEAVHQDLKEDLRDVAGRLDGKVSNEVFKLEQAAQDRAALAVAERVAAIEAARAREAEQREADRREAERRRRDDRRLILAALVVPVLLVFLTAYLSTKGAGS